MRILATLSLVLCCVFAAANDDEFALGDEFEPNTEVELLIRDGISLHDQMLYEDAIVLFEKALAAEPENAYAAYELALTYWRKGEYELCIEWGDHALAMAIRTEAESYYTEALWGIYATCHASLGQTNEALKIYQDGLANYPDSYDLHYNVGITLYNSKQHEASAEHFLAAMAISPYEPGPYYMIAGVLEIQDQFALAALAYIAVLQLEFNTERAYESSIYLLHSMHVGMPSYTPKVRDQSGGESLYWGLLGLQLVHATAGVGLSDEFVIDESDPSVLAMALQKFLQGSRSVDLGNDDSTAYVREFLLPMRDQITDEDLTEVFAWYVVATAGVAGADAWLAEHDDDVDRLVDSFRPIAEYIED